MISDTSERRAINRERVARLRTGKYIAPEKVREERVSGVCHGGTMQEPMRSYVPPRDRMLQRLYARQSELHDREGEDHYKVLAELDWLGREIRRLQSSGGIT